MLFTAMIIGSLVISCENLLHPLQTSSPKVVEQIPIQGVDERFFRMDQIIQYYLIFVIWLESLS